MKSTLAAETLALEQACESAILIRCLICELLNFDYNDMDILKIKCRTDNKSLVDAVYTTKTLNLTEKRLKIDICVLRDMIEKGEISTISWGESDTQLADSLTKCGASNKRLLDVLSGREENYRDCYF